MSQKLFKNWIYLQSSAQILDFGKDFDGYQAQDPIKLHFYTQLPPRHKPAIISLKIFPTADKKVNTHDVNLKKQMNSKIKYFHQILLKWRQKILPMATFKDMMFRPCKLLNRGQKHNQVATPIGRSFLHSANSTPFDFSLLKVYVPDLLF